MYYLYNGHGDVTGLADTTGNITKTYNYDAFGVELNPDSEDKNPFRYCGEYYDKETNSIYLRARYYNPMLGRFMSEDPAKDGLNWYAYCGNNPIMFIDPTGKTLADAIYGSLETIDNNLFSGAATFISEWLTKQKYDYNPKNQQHYYIGRIVGDVFSILAGAGVIKSGSSMIMAGLGAEGGLALMTDGTSLVLLDWTVAVSLTTAGTVAITYGGKTIVSSAEGLYDDINKLIKLSNGSEEFKTSLDYKNTITKKNGNYYADKKI